LDMPAEATAPEERLTLRQREILRVLIQDYVSLASPVGSARIQQIGRLGVSSATIRNELSVLERLGYLEQPHTSAGRVPTAKGYRYFVEQLMERVELPASERRTISHQFYQVRLNLDQWMKLSATVLAQMAQAASLVTPPHAASSQLKHLELISINQSTSLMILLLRDGSTYQEVFRTPSHIDQEGLRAMSRRLSTWLHGCTAQEIRASANSEVAGLEGWSAGLLERIASLMEQANRRSVGRIYSDGLANVLRHQESLEIEGLRQVVAMLEHASLLDPILMRILDANGVQIIIGGEGRYEAIDRVSLVLSRYGVKGKASGVLGVLGPTRMPYARAVSTVRFVAHLVSSLVADVYGIYA